MKPVLMLLCALAIPLPALEAQHARRDRLDRPTRTFPEPFSSIAGLRRLDDGRIVVADRLEKAVRLVDPRAGTMEDVGRVGSGPGEYQLPSGLLPLPGDSTLLVDFGNMRLSVISPDGRITRSTSLLRGDGRLVHPTAADAAGGLYFDGGGVRIAAGSAEQADSTLIQRMDAATEAIEPVASLPLPDAPPASMRGFSAGGGTIQLSGGLGPFTAANAWSVAPDGRVAIVYADPYRVAWVAPDGTTRTGPAVEYEPVPVTRRDKEAWADRVGGSGAVMVVAGGGPGGGQGNRGITLPRPDPGDMEWPEVKPPFPRQAATVSPSGELWVQRHVAHGAAPVYDVFDAAGRRTRQVELPPGRRLVGFGRDVVYLVDVDEDDLQWLEEYRTGS